MAKIEVNVKELEVAKVVSGPFDLFSDSFRIEFLEPPTSLNATVLMRATYFSSSPLIQQGKSHPQSPPLHLHFDQSETFLVVSGSVGTTETWAAKDEVWTAENTPHEIKPWVP
ncbi:hypothetical protein BCR34DRAFT_596063 [Clohesyomyces aquaticus]|uniref:Cupin 2 conserved barrel domain-containing protein n=1 Tax=Clohesyomyces aquaticus TaxID=1231657 RepID=A0A1Y2A8L2_9PLEO|nr:hypothetical protein BCR34DRAFT_596063 [Clohesyomyces aquaticus]